MLIRVGIRHTTQGIRSFIGSPLLVQEQPIGILAIGRRDERLTRRMTPTLSSHLPRR